MSDFRINISSNAAQVLRELDTFPDRMSLSIARALDFENQLTVGQISRQRLTGHPAQPYPVGEGKLRLITGTYRQRLAYTPARIRGNQVESFITVGVKYAAAQEFGFHGSVQVPAHTRRTFTRTSKSGKTLKKPKAIGNVPVRAYSMLMNVPARAPISRGIEARLPAYQRAIDAAIISAWNGGRG